MREIKFRGKCAITGQWVYGYFVLEKGINSIITFDGIKLLIISGTKGQYTGLKDKNGTEIYEKDIVKIRINHNSIAYEGTNPKYYTYVEEAVGFHNCKFITYDFHNTQPIKNHSPQSLREIWSDCYEYEIIGNIYESIIKEAK